MSDLEEDDAPRRPLRYKRQSSSQTAENLKRQLRRAEYRRRKTLERYFQSSEQFLNSLPEFGRPGTGTGKPLALNHTDFVLSVRE